MGLLPCLPNKNKNKQQNRQSLSLDAELHAFDLTWRNYLPSTSQFCCCFQSGGNIKLVDDDPLIEPPYYNDQTLYREQILDNPRNWEFDSVLNQSDLPFVTRNPFGTKSIKSKKKSSRKKKNKRERPAVMETDVEEDLITGYDIEQDHKYYNDDAEFLGDDQIANLAYNRHSQAMDQYGEELYYEQIQGPISQEMQIPQNQLIIPPPKKIYAARTMPDINFMPQNDDQDYEDRIFDVPSSSKPHISVESAQALISEKLDDLTEKLAFIKNNIIFIKPPQKHQGEEEDEADRNTLHTLHQSDHEEVVQDQPLEDEEEQNHSSDMDSITSEALNLYENTSNNHEQNMHQQRRYSTGDEFDLPSLADNTPFVSDQHPFTYFTSTNSSSSINPQEEQVLNMKNVLDLGRKWLGI